MLIPFCHRVGPAPLLTVDASQESYSFGKFEIARPESFAESELSFAFVNLKPIVPGTGFAECCSAMKYCGVLQTHGSSMSLLRREYDNEPLNEPGCCHSFAQGNASA